jgi:hypothetical protein
LLVYSRWATLVSPCRDALFSKRCNVPSGRVGEAEWWLLDWLSPIESRRRGGHLKTSRGRRLQQYIKLKVTEPREFYVWVPADDDASALEKFWEGHDPRIQVAHIRFGAPDVEIIGPALPNDREMTVSMFAYLESLRNVPEQVEQP